MVSYIYLYVYMYVNIIVDIDHNDNPHPPTILPPYWLLCFVWLCDVNRSVHYVKIVGFAEKNTWKYLFNYKKETDVCKHLKYFTIKAS